MSNAIEIKGLTKYYGKHRGIIELNMEVPKGALFGFLGPNGAGKSTTIRCLLGMIHPTSGSAEILGYEIGKNRRKILSKTGYMPSEAMFQPALKAGEVIKFAADVRGIDCSGESKRLCEALELDTSRRISELSLGNRKKVSIVCAMQHKPELLILDEPTSGLDPLMQAVFFELVGEYVKNGSTCFLSSHVLSEVKRYCDRAAIIREGKLAAVDTVENLTSTAMRTVRARGITAPPQIEGVRGAKSDGDGCEFSYDGDMKALIKALSQLPVSDLIIGEPSIEDIFIHYYQ